MSFKDADGSISLEGTASGGSTEAYQITSSAVLYFHTLRCVSLAMDIPFRLEYRNVLKFYFSLSVLMSVLSVLLSLFPSLHFSFPFYVSSVYTSFPLFP
jgi:hypothetical protein